MWAKIWLIYPCVGCHANLDIISQTQRTMTDHQLTDFRSRISDRDCLNCRGFSHRRHRRLYQNQDNMEGYISLRTSRTFRNIAHWLYIISTIFIFLNCLQSPCHAQNELVAAGKWYGTSYFYHRYCTMTSFSALLALCVGNSAVTGEFPAQRTVTQNFDVCFDLRLNWRLSKQSWGWWFGTPSRPLWRHSNGSLMPPKPCRHQL